MRSLLFLGLLGTLLLLTLVGVLLWRRFYRDDPQNSVRRIFKNSAVPLALRLLVRALDLIFAVVLLDTLPGVNIGRYDLAALLVVQYLGTITEFGLGVLLTREVAREPDAARRLFGVTLTLRWLLVAGAVPVTALLIGVYGLLGRFGIGEAISGEGQLAIWILMLTLVPAAYSGAVTALYNAHERMEVPALVELLTALLSFAARISVLLLGFGILGIAWAAVGVATTTALLYRVLQGRTFFPPTLTWERATLQALMPQALPLMFNNLLAVVFFRFDTFIIKAFGGGGGDLLVKQYNLAYQILSVPMILPPVITFAVFPLLARRANQDRAGMANAQNRTLQVLLWLAFPAAMGLSVLAPTLVRLFALSNAPTYVPISAHALAILAWFLPLSFANGLFQYVLIAIGEQRAITRAFLLGAAFNVAANLLLVPWFGIYAASGVTIGSEVVLLAVFWPLLRRGGLTPPLFALAWRPLLAALAMGAAMVGALRLGGWGGEVLAVVVAAPVYAVALVLLKSGEHERKAESGERRT